MIPQRLYVAQVAPQVREKLRTRRFSSLPPLFWPLDAVAGSAEALLMPQRLHPSTLKPLRPRVDDPFAGYCFAPAPVHDLLVFARIPSWRFLLEGEALSPSHEDDADAPPADVLPRLALAQIRSRGLPTSMASARPAPLPCHPLPSSPDRLATVGADEIISCIEAAVRLRRPREGDLVRIVGMGGNPSSFVDRYADKEATLVKIRGGKADVLLTFFRRDVHGECDLQNLIPIARNRVHAAA